MIFEENPPRIIQEFNHREVMKFLGGRSFTKAFNGMLARTQEYEQGLIVCSSSKRKLTVVEFKEITETQAAFPYEEIRGRNLIPLLGVHTHPIEETVGPAPYSYYPADEDLALPNEEWDELTTLKAASSVVIASHPPQLWLWQRPTGENLYAILREWRGWEQTLTGYPTQRDLEALKVALKMGGLKLTTGALTSKNPASDFAKLFNQSGVGLGFS